MPVLQSTLKPRASEIRTMNRFIHIIAAALLIETGGCGARKGFVIRDSVWPDKPLAGSLGNEGCLIVYSGREILDPTKSRHPVHTCYAIFSDDGKVFRRVTNQSGAFFEEPVGVSLPAGAYKVEARATNCGEVAIPVVIQAGKLTTLYLDGETEPLNSATSSNQWVTLPNGQIVGAKAPGPSQAAPP